MLKRIFQSVICLCCWLTFSPLFFFLSKRWELLGNKFRWVALFISPLFLIIYIPIGFIGHDYFNRRFCAIDRGRIERIAHISFPDFSLCNYKYGARSFTGDYTDTFTVEFYFDKLWFVFKKGMLYTIYQTIIISYFIFHKVIEKEYIGIPKDIFYLPMNRTDYCFLTALTVAFIGLSYLFGRNKRWVIIIEGIIYLSTALYYILMGNEILRNYIVC